jgi:flagellar hook-associated protein 1
MASSILSIGQSALTAAQVGLSTTGHNIANAATPGYNRQAVVQGAAQAQSYGFGFLGQGTDVSTVKRIYNDFLGGQVRTAQANKSALDSHYAQIRQIDNMLADPASGLSPALQAFSAASRRCRPILL